MQYSSNCRHILNLLIISQGMIIRKKILNLEFRLIRKNSCFYLVLLKHGIRFRTKCLTFGIKIVKNLLVV